MRFTVQFLFLCHACSAVTIRTRDVEAVVRHVAADLDGSDFLQRLSYVEMPHNARTGELNKDWKGMTTLEYHWSGNQATHVHTGYTRTRPSLYVHHLPPPVVLSLQHDSICAARTCPAVGVFESWRFAIFRKQRSLQLRELEVPQQ
jgi:hypothetical protein